MNQVAVNNEQSQAVSEVVCLGDICRLINGRAYKKKELLSEGKYPVLRVGNFFTNRSWYYSDLELDDDKYCDDDDLLYAWSASFGPRIWHGGKVIYHYHIWKIDIDYSKVLKEFLYYWLDWDTEQIKADQGAGTTMTHVTKGSMEARPLLLPSLPEQKRIVAILDEAFSGISQAVANAEKNLANARELFESYLNSVFTQKGEGWVEKSLGEVIHITHGFSFKGADFEVSEDENRPIVLTPGNYTEDATLRFNKKNTKRLMIDPPNGYEFDEGDLTIVMTDLSSKMKILGKPALIKRKGILHNQRIGRILFNDTSIRKQYLYYYLQTRKVSDIIKFTATGTMVRHTAPSRILSNKITFPVSNGEQDEIVKELDLLKKKAQQLETIYQKKLTALAELKQSILQKAFIGELAA